jgi:hypothetical protein
MQTTMIVSVVLGIALVLLGAGVFAVIRTTSKADEMYEPGTKEMNLAASMAVQQLEAY